jgi:hypothetical protein
MPFIMKSLERIFILFICLLLIPSTLFSQNHFEGIIRYEIKNPTNTDVAGMLPKFTEYHIKGSDLILQMIDAEGQMMTRILIQGRTGAFYMIDDVEKTALKVVVRSEDVEGLGNVPEAYREAYEKALKDAEEETEFDRFDLEKTGEIASIAGYTCEKYIARAENEDISVDTEVWLTDKIKVKVPEALKDKNNPLLVFMDESGFPLKFKGQPGSGPGSQTQRIEMTAVAVTRKTLDPSDFLIPDDYHISDMTNLMGR